MFDRDNFARNFALICSKVHPDCRFLSPIDQNIIKLDLMRLLLLTFTYFKRFFTFANHYN